MQILEDFSLKPYNTFGIDAKAKYFVNVNTITELKKALKLQNHPNRFILGGGSNMLLTKNLDALVIHVNLKGKTIISETSDKVIVKVNAGENWHDFVLWCLNNTE